MGQSHFSIPFDLTSFHRRGSTRGLCYLTFILTVHATVQINYGGNSTLILTKLWASSISFSSTCGISPHFRNYEARALNSGVLQFGTKHDVFDWCNILEMLKEKSVCWRNSRLKRGRSESYRSIPKNILLNAEAQPNFRLRTMLWDLSNWPIVELCFNTM